MTHARLENCVALAAVLFRQELKVIDRAHVHDCAHGPLLLLFVCRARMHRLDSGAVYLADLQMRRRHLIVRPHRHREPGTIARHPLPL